MSRRVVGCAVLFYGAVTATLLCMRYVVPPTTAVQTERRMSAFLTGQPYRKEYRFVALAQISPHLVHAAISAEDARFFQHHGFDWKEIHNAAREDLEEGRRRGASTITQQLARNLFLSTSPSIIRKAVEFTIVPICEAVLSKQRILELYLNVVEWGPGIYGADAAAEHYDGCPAGQLTRTEAIELVTILPAPLHRRPGTSERYAQRIREHMHQAGW